MSDDQPFPIPIASKGKKYTSVFHLRATLTQEIACEPLQRALERTTARFPFLRSYKRGGVLVPSSSSCRVRALETEPCLPFSKGIDGLLLYRCLYTEHTIMMEFDHALTDGNGALPVFKTLLYCYLTEIGITCGTEGILLPDAKAGAQESAYGFSEYSANTSMGKQPRLQKAFHLESLYHQRQGIWEISASVLRSELKERSERLAVTVNDYLVACYLYALYLIALRHAKTSRPIRVCVPVNLRPIYSFESLLNFSLFVRPEIHPQLGTYTLEEIATHVHHSIRYDLQLGQLSSAVTKGILSGPGVFSKVFSSRTRSFFWPIGNHRKGEQLHSGTLSNLGKVTLPEGMREHVDRVGFLLGRNQINPENCSVVEYGKRLFVSFTGITPDPEAAREFFRILIGQGIEVRMISPLT